VKRARLPVWEWITLLLLILLAWALRVVQPAAVPPGWRDDELINIHALTGQVLAGQPQLYFTGASGHEPLYHTLHAVTIATVGMNVLGGHLLSIVAGTLTIPSTYVLARRLFGRFVAITAAALLAASFWSLMYSRVAIRHALVLPPVLGAFYFLWPRRADPPRAQMWRGLGGGVLLATALYTYTVSRILPFVLLAFGLYLVLLHRQTFRRWWRLLLVALLVAALLTAPLWLAIEQGRSKRAAQGIGADARIAELSRPARALMEGDPGPLLENSAITLQMFHVSGDAEWLYNLPGRPVFGLLGAALLFAGLGLCLVRWRHPANALLLIWLIAGLSPAFLTLPPASLGHTILAQPVAYVLPALPLAAAYGLQKRQRRDPAGAGKPALLALVLVGVVTGLLVASNTARDLRDYFVVWPERGMVRFLYRADYRQSARCLDDHPDWVDVAVGGGMVGPWDRLALLADLQRDDLRLRMFNPQRALLLPSGPAPAVLLSGYPDPDPVINALLESASAEQHGRQRLIQPPDAFLPVAGGPTARFANGLDLTGGWWAGEKPSPGQEATLLLAWQVARTLDLPPLPIVANPPPPGAYAGPRLAVFTHLFAADGSLVAVDDGLWVDPALLRAGDRFVQLHRFVLPADAPAGPYRVEIGLYDPKSGDRWSTTAGADWAVWDD